MPEYVQVRRTRDFRLECRLRQRELSVRIAGHLSFAATVELTDALHAKGRLADRYSLDLRDVHTIDAAAETWLIGHKLRFADALAIYGWTPGGAGVPSERGGEQP